jgi:hypothetical protein
MNQQMEGLNINPVPVFVPEESSQIPVPVSMPVSVPMPVSVQGKEVSMSFY